MGWLTLATATAVMWMGAAASHAQDDDSESVKRVKIKVMQHHDCDGDDCEEGLHEVHSNQAGNVMIFKTRGGEGEHHEGNVRKVFFNEGGESTVLSGDDRMLWVSEDGQDFSFGGGAFLGVQMVELTDALRRRFDVRDGVGVMVSEVVEGSPAEAAGIQAGDIITAVDGEEISGSMALSHKMRGFEEGENVAFEISSDGSTKVINATLAKRESPVAKVRRIGGPGHKMRFHDLSGSGNAFFHQCDEEDGECDVQVMVERIGGDHGVIDIDGLDLEGLDCGDSGSCEIEVTCENGDCVCVVDGSEVACGGDD